MINTGNKDAKCTMRGHRVAIGLTANLMHQVGCDGYLVGNYKTAEQAIFAAQEYVRMKAGGVHRMPRVTQKFRDAVAELVSPWSR